MYFYSFMIWFVNLCVCNCVMAQTSKQFVWGINGHPLTQEAYKQTTWDRQVLFLKELGIKSYRMDVPLDPKGVIRHEVKFRKFVNALRESGVSILPVVFPKFNRSDTDSIAVYDMLFNEGKVFCKRYYHLLDVVEVGNELEIGLLKKKGTTDGTKAGHYDLAKSRNLMWNLAAFIDGMKSVKPTIRVSLSLAWTHWYYLELLKSYGVNYDIIGYHWYDNMGDITNVVKPYGNFLPKLIAEYDKEIWITEFNIYKGTLTKSVERQNSYLENSLSKILQQGIVKGFFFYELFDESALQSKLPHEAHYGLLFEKDLQYYKKPAFYTYQQFIKRNKSK